MARKIKNGLAYSSYYTLAVFDDDSAFDRRNAAAASTRTANQILTTGTPTIVHAQMGYCKFIAIAR